ncbi:hypothetical protein ACFYXS_11895 [Streptomyces sp. NPDC002574]|uniref:hypothetical protein n=1 Tax=Streptomyces sp. NPDC002574 TaxID=3364652 RepID=UPI00369F7F53
MTVAWSFHSRGRLPEQGYTWLPAGRAQGAAPEVLLRGCAGRSVNDLVDDTKSSLLLYALKDGAGARPLWVLLLTGLRSADDTGDHMRRPIRLLLLGTGPGVGSKGLLPPPELLSVARLFLTGGMEQDLPVAHGHPAGTAGFAVDVSGWDALLERARACAPEVVPLPGPNEIRLAPDSPADRVAAAGMLADLERRLARTGSGLDGARLVGPGARPLLIVTSLLGSESLLAVRPLHALGARVGRPVHAKWDRQNGQSFLEGSVRRMTDALGRTGLVLTLLVLGALGALGAVLAVVI